MANNLIVPTELIAFGPLRPVILNGLASFKVHCFSSRDEIDSLAPSHLARIRGIALVGPVSGTAELFSRFQNLEIVASFGVGYDHIDVAYASDRGVIVTNTPDVLTEETADTVLGLLLCTVRDLVRADLFVRRGAWLQGAYPLSETTLRDRTVGIVGMGRIGRAIARRLEAMRVPVVYHSRRPVEGVGYRYIAKLVDLAREADTMIVVTPGGQATIGLIDGEILEALGRNGILINAARGSVVDEPALIAALRHRIIRAAGLDVFAHEPRVPAELIAMENVVLFPHLGSSTVYTRSAMEQLVVDNLNAWFATGKPLTPVPETPLSIARGNLSTARA